MAPIDLAAAPFNLDDEAMAWVHATRDSLTPRDKLAQLFVLLARGEPDEVLRAIARLQARRHYPCLFG
ncbi:hypothetical protein N8D56_03730 [Devosia sp. A8/3-2]|nr:hypothetical protein N8D56_03730 [Devosia sp. A8/3-2]